LTQPAFYENSETYNAWAQMEHGPQAKKLLENVPLDWEVIEPGCGGGLLSFRPHVISTDLVPPKRDQPRVFFQKDIATTIKEYAKMDSPYVHKKKSRDNLALSKAKKRVFFLSYISAFMRDEDWKRLEHIPWIAVDASSQIIPGEQLFPGVWYNRLLPEHLPSSFEGEKLEVGGSVRFTNNLLALDDITYINENVYVRYYRSMYPLRPVVSNRTSKICVVATLREWKEAMLRCYDHIYLGPIGKEVDIPLSVPVVSAHSFFPLRTMLYSEDPIVRAFPSIEWSKGYAFFDASETTHSRIVELSSISHIRRIKFTFLSNFSEDEMEWSADIVSSRIYVRAGLSSFMLKRPNSKTELRQICREYFHSIVPPVTVRKALDVQMESFLVSFVDVQEWKDYLGNDDLWDVDVEVVSIESGPVKSCVVCKQVKPQREFSKTQLKKVQARCSICVVSHS